jgi:hypothetical protein
MTLRLAIAAAFGVGTAAGLLAWWLPEPSSTIGTLAVALSVGLSVIVAYLSWRVREDGERLARIERLISDEVTRGR